jgi:hypothetical protein
MAIDLNDPRDRSRIVCHGGARPLTDVASRDAVDYGRLPR